MKSAISVTCLLLLRSPSLEIDIRNVRKVPVEYLPFLFGVLFHGLTWAMISQRFIITTSFHIHPLWFRLQDYLNASLIHPANNYI